MTFYFAMINAWSLAWEALNGTMDEEYPIIDTSVGAGNTAAEKTNRYNNDGLDGVLSKESHHSLIINIQ